MILFLCVMMEKNSSENTINELKISLNQENKYIDLRNALSKIDKKLIKGFIFIYHFSEKENVEKRENQGYPFIYLIFFD